RHHGKFSACISADWVGGAGGFACLAQAGQTGQEACPTMIAPASRKIRKYEIVLKLIEQGTDADTIAAIEAERRGAELQAHLAAIDPRVVRVYGAGDADGFFFVAMEYVDGQDLEELMRKGALALGFATEVA